MTPEDEARYLLQMELGIDEMLDFLGEKPKFLPTLKPEEKEQYLAIKRQFDNRPTTESEPAPAAEA